MILIIQHTKSGEPATVIKYENKEDMRIKLCNHLVKSQINSANLYFNNLVGKHVNRHVFVDVGRYMDYPDRFFIIINEDNNPYRIFTKVDINMLEEQIYMHAVNKAVLTYNELINDKCVWDDISNITYTFVEV